MTLSTIWTRNVLLVKNILQQAKLTGVYDKYDSVLYNKNTPLGSELHSSESSSTFSFIRNHGRTKMYVSVESYLIVSDWGHMHWKICSSARGTTHHLSHSPSMMLQQHLYRGGKKSHLFSPASFNLGTVTNEKRWHLMSIDIEPVPTLWKLLHLSQVLLETPSSLRGFSWEMSASVTGSLTLFERQLFCRGAVQDNTVKILLDITWIIFKVLIEGLPPKRFFRSNH